MIDWIEPYLSSDDLQRPFSDYEGMLLWLNTNVFSLINHQEQQARDHALKFYLRNESRLRHQTNPNKIERIGFLLYESNTFVINSENCKFHFIFKRNNHEERKYPDDIMVFELISNANDQPYIYNNSNNNIPNTTFSYRRRYKPGTGNGSNTLFPYAPLSTTPEGIGFWLRNHVFSSQDGQRASAFVNANEMMFFGERDPLSNQSSYHSFYLFTLPNNQRAFAYYEKFNNEITKLSLKAEEIVETDPQPPTVLSLGRVKMSLTKWRKPNRKYFATDEQVADELYSNIFVRQNWTQLVDIFINNNRFGPGNDNDQRISRYTLRLVQGAYTNFYRVEYRTYTSESDGNRSAQPIEFSVRQITSSGLGSFYQRSNVDYKISRQPPNRFFAFVTSTLHQQLTVEFSSNFNQWLSDNSVTSTAVSRTPSFFDPNNNSDIFAKETCQVFDITHRGSYNQDLYSGWGNFFDSIKKTLKSYIAQSVHNAFYQAKATEDASSGAAGTYLDQYLRHVFQDLYAAQGHINEDNPILTGFNQELEKICLRKLIGMALYNFDYYYQQENDSYRHRALLEMLNWGKQKSSYGDQTIQTISNDPRIGLPSIVKQAFNSQGSNKVHLLFYCNPVFLHNTTDSDNSYSKVTLYLYHKIKVIDGNLDVASNEYPPLEGVSISRSTGPMVFDIANKRSYVFTSPSTTATPSALDQRRSGLPAARPQPPGNSQEVNPLDRPYLGCYASLTKASARDIIANVTGYIQCNENRRVTLASTVASSTTNSTSTTTSTISNTLVSTADYGKKEWKYENIATVGASLSFRASLHELLSQHCILSYPSGFNKITSIMIQTNLNDTSYPGIKSKLINGFQDFMSQENDREKVSSWKVFTFVTAHNSRELKASDRKGIALSLLKDWIDAIYLITCISDSNQGIIPGDCDIIFVYAKTYHIAEKESNNVNIISNNRYKLPNILTQAVYKRRTY